MAYWRQQALVTVPELCRYCKTGYASNVFRNQYACSICAFGLQQLMHGGSTGAAVDAHMLDLLEKTDDLFVISLIADRYCDEHWLANYFALRKTLRG